MALSDVARGQLVRAIDGILDVSSHGGEAAGALAASLEPLMTPSVVADKDLAPIADLLADALRRLRSGDLSPADFKSALELLDGSAAASAASDATVLIQSRFEVHVDYAVNLTDAFAQGNFEPDNTDAMLVFKRQQLAPQKLVMRLLNPNDMRLALGAKDSSLRPATIEELVAFVLAFPHFANEYPLIGAGSMGIVGDKKVVPCIHAPSGKPRLSYARVGGLWQDHDRFLIVEIGK